MLKAKNIEDKHSENCEENPNTEVSQTGNNQKTQGIRDSITVLY